MWSHYAESHTGFVIGFDSSSPFFSPENGKAKNGLKSVRYTNKRYIIPKNGFQSLDDPKMQEANIGMFFTKGTYWRYEREMRILATPNSADHIFSGHNGQNICLFNFPSESVKEVIFGFKISEYDQRHIFEVVCSKYPKAIVGKAFPHQSDYSIDIKMFNAMPK
jgi:hypothetical protein